MSSFEQSTKTDADEIDSPVPVVSETCASAEPEACPTPLGWKQVLRKVHEESQEWELERNGTLIRGRTFGNGPPLYFINGLGGTSDLFLLTAWLLRDDFRCVVFDYSRGCNSLDRMTEDLFAIADAQGDQRFSLYATSFGCLVGLKAMLQFPERVESSVLQGGFAYRKLSLFETMLARLNCFAPGTFRRVPFRKKIQLWNHRRWFPPFDQSRWQFFVDNTGELPISLLARRAVIVGQSDLRSQLSAIKQPVLLIRSEGEGMVAEECHRELEAGLSISETELMKSTGHIPYLTHPHRLVKLIRPFLQMRGIDSRE